jgi:hypothetical protein
MAVVGQFEYGADGLSISSKFCPVGGRVASIHELPRRRVFGNPGGGYEGRKRGLSGRYPALSCNSPGLVDPGPLDYYYYAGS